VDGSFLSTLFIPGRLPVGLKSHKTGRKTNLSRLTAVLESISEVLKEMMRSFKRIKK